MSELDKAIERFNRIICEILDNGLVAIDAINAGLGMIADAERQARHEMRATQFTNCTACQSSLVIFLNDTPQASDETCQAVTESLWESCPTCIDEYADYLNSITCKHGVQNWENCDACLDEWAESNAPECDGYLDNPSEWEVRNGY